MPQGRLPRSAGGRMMDIDGDRGGVAASPPCPGDPRAPACQGSGVRAGSSLSYGSSAAV